MIDKLLVICGPTATGKTSLALHLAKLYGGELISADSRQVYQDIDLVSGKNLPKGARIQKSKIKWKGRTVGFYRISNVKIWGYDLVGPKDEFSVAAYFEIVNQVLTKISVEKKLPILVGGTGLYIKAVIEGIDTISIPRNLQLRNRMLDKNREELLELLNRIDPIKSASFNSSDRRNPVRLVRAIEIAQNRGQTVKNIKIDFKDILRIGLFGSTNLIHQRIDQRIKESQDSGVEDEIKSLIDSGVEWDNQSMSALGAKVWREYLQGKTEKEKIIEDWKRREYRYYKDQLAWFNKEKKIIWFDIGHGDWVKSVENLVKKWYYSNINETTN